MTDPMVPVLYRVEQLIRDTQDTFTLALTPERKKNRGAGGFAFRPGQFNMLYSFGAGEVPISISGDPASSGPLVHTIRAVGNVTRGLGNVRAGDALGVRGPFGSAWPVEEAQGKDVIIVAGGIGLAPLRPVLYHLMKHRKKYGKVSLCYGTRSPADILYSHALIEWETCEVDVHVTVDHAPKTWKGNVGVVTSLIPKIAPDPQNGIAMICGPEIMMAFTVRALMEQGMKEEDLYISTERNMKCAVGFCGHCQYGPYFICKDGPVFRYDRVKRIFRVPEI